MRLRSELERNRIDRLAWSANCRNASTHRSRPPLLLSHRLVDLATASPFHSGERLLQQDLVQNRRLCGDGVELEFYECAIGEFGEDWWRVERDVARFGGDEVDVRLEANGEYHKDEVGRDQGQVRGLATRDRIEFVHW